MSFDVDENKKRNIGQDLWDHPGYNDESIADYRVTAEEDEEARRAFRMDQGDSRRVLRESRKRKPIARSGLSARSNPNVRQNLNVRPNPNARQSQYTRRPQPIQKYPPRTTGRAIVWFAMSFIFFTTVIIGLSTYSVHKKTETLYGEQSAAEKIEEEAVEEALGDPEEWEDTEDWEYSGPPIDDAFYVEVPEGFVDNGDRFDTEEGQGRIWYKLDKDGEISYDEARIYADILYDYTPEILTEEIPLSSWSEIFKANDITFYIMYYYDSEEAEEHGRQTAVAAYFTDGTYVYDIYLGRWDGKVLTKEMGWFYDMLDTVSFEK